MKFYAVYFVLFTLLASTAQAEDMAAPTPAPMPEVSADVLENLPLPEEHSSVAEMPTMTAPTTQQNGGAKFSLLYSSASRGKYEGVNSYADSFTGEDVFSGGAPGASIEYSYRRADSVGFSAGAAYQGKRTMKTGSFSFTEDPSGRIRAYSYRDERKLSLLLPTANLNYSFGNNLYGFAGLNYSVPNYSSDANDSFRGRLGWQMGLGFEVVKQVDVDLTYQRLNFKYTEGALTFDSYSMSGIMLQLGYRI